jgi:iron(III) transport system substrate-binding protein
MAGDNARRALALIAVGASVTVAASACGSTVTSSAAGNAGTATTTVAPAAVDSLVGQSRNENALTIYGNPPTALFQPVVDAFQNQYPWIRVTAQDLDDTTVFSKATAEQAQGAPTADILIATDPARFLSAARNGVLKTDYTPAGLADFPSYASQGNGIYVMSPEPAMISYSPRVITDPAHVPHSMSDLVTLAQAGVVKLTSYPVTNTLGYSAIWAYVTQKGDAAWTTLGRLASDTKTEMEGLNQLQGVLKGTYGAGYFTSGLGRAFIPQYRGLVDMTYATDFQPLVPRGIALTRSAAHAASAQLFLDFIYSRAGQDVICASGFTAFMNGYQSSSGCRNSVADIAQHVPQANIYLVPFSQKLLDDQSSIAARWKQVYGR